MGRLPETNWQRAKMIGLIIRTSNLEDYFLMKGRSHKVVRFLLHYRLFGLLEVTGVKLAVQCGNKLFEMEEGREYIHPSV